MKINVAVTAHNSNDWDRIDQGQYDQPIATPDARIVTDSLLLGDLAEPLGFDGIWVSEHFGTPYGMTPNPLQTLAYFAGRTERVHLGTMVAVIPWWNPIRFAHQVAYLDILSKGRYDTIGLGRGTAKTEFDTLGVPRDESRERFAECLDILELALTQERFSYEGEIFKIPENSLRPQAYSSDLVSRLYGASSTSSSMEIMARRGLKPLFVGNKPMEAAAKDVLMTNIYRQEVGLPPCQSKNILFTYCAATEQEADDANEYIERGNRDVSLHYGFANRESFVGVKGYEAYAAGEGTATSLTSGSRQPGTGKAYDRSNLLIGTPDQIIQQIQRGQQLCSFEEITIAGKFGNMPQDKAEASLRLFAKEVLPVVHKMDTPLHDSVIPGKEQAA